MKEYMEKVKLKKTIRSYICSNEDELALFIDGEWGTGKSYFFEHEIIPEVKEMKKKPILVSLYGLRNLDDLYSNIYLKMMEEYIPKSFNKEIVKKCGETLSNVLTSVKPEKIDFGNDIFKMSIGVPTINDIIKIINTWSNIDEYVIIFDDFERSEIAPHKALGFINNFLINKKCKCIIIGNENEINKLAGQENIEMKYLVALNERLMLESKKINTQQNIKPEKQLKIEELKQITEDLFGENAEYNLMKEKVIGRTLYYRQDLGEVIENLAKRKGYESIRDIILENKERIVLILNLKKYSNIRTIMFAFKEFRRLFPILNSLDLEKDKYYKCAIQSVLIDIVYTSIEYKRLNMKHNAQNNYEYRAVNFGIKGFYSIVNFEFVNNLITTGTVDGSDIKETLEKYIEEQKDKAKDLNDPYNKLSNYIDMEDEEILDNIERLKAKLEKGEYLISYYSKLISIMVKIVTIGYNEKILEDVTEIMKNNIKRATEEQIKEAKFVRYGVMSETEKEKEMFDKYMVPLRNILKEKKSSVKQTELDLICESKDNWGDQLENYYLIKDGEILNSRKFLKEFNIKRILELIIDSNNCNLSSFRRTINSVYGFSNIKDYYLDDYDSIVELEKGINEILNNSKIKLGISKKYNLTQLDEDLKNIIKLLHE